MSREAPDFISLLTILVFIINVALWAQVLGGL